MLLIVSVRHTFTLNYSLSRHTYNRYIIYNRHFYSFIYFLSLIKCVARATVLPILDYCCCVWDPYQSTHTAKLEKVQKFAAKLATGLWLENYDYLLSLLNWPTLATRRQQQKLLLCRRILTGNSIIPQLFLHPGYPAPDLCHYHYLPPYKPSTRTQVHLGSYLPSVVPLLYHSTLYLPALNSLSSIP